VSRHPSDPPRLVLALVRHVLPRDRRQEAEGDLVELWRRRLAAGRTDLWRSFWRDAWSLIAPRRHPPFAARRSSAIVTGVEALSQDLRFALRLLRRQPLFGALLIGTLTVGVTAAIAIFTLCDRVLFRPLPYPEPERVVSIAGQGFGMANGHPVVRKALADLPEFTSVALYGSGGLNLGDNATPLRVRAAGVTAGFFNALAVPARLGRTFDTSEELAASAVVVLGDNLWRTRFGSDPDVAGKTTRLNGRPYTILGVMPPGFGFPEEADLWAPLFTDAQMYGSAIASNYIARLGPGVSIAQARAAIDRMGRDRQRLQPDYSPPPTNVVSLQDRLVGRVRPTLLFLAGGVGLLLLATCANVAGLLLARLRVREHELLLRAALGASRGRLARQLLVECATVTIIGAAAGTGLAVLVLRGIAASVPNLSPAGALLTLDGRFLLVTAGVVMSGGVLFALAPVVSASRRRTAHVLRAGVTNTARMGWIRSGLVIGQVATALILLTATSAALSVVARLSRVDLGFDNDRAVVFELTIPQVRYDTAAAIVRVARDLDAALSRTPGVTAAGLSSLAPASHDLAIGSAIAREGQTIDKTSVSQRTTMRLSATPGYFRAMGIRLLAGRSFSDADNVPGARLVVLSERAAAHLWGSARAAVGRRILVSTFVSADPQILEVIGVVNDVQLRGAETAEAQMYFPFAADPPPGTLAVAVATTGDPALVMAAVQREIDTVDPDLPLYNRLLVSNIRARFLEKERFTLALTSGFGLVALALCAIGLYGVLTQIVMQQTREIGIRMALGAAPRRLLADVVGSGVRLALIGVAIGALGSGAAARVIGRFVPAVDAPSVRAIALDAVVLVLVAIVAAWMPARRASTIDPLIALRTD
jgi:putative ABC transport system permease protein